MRIVECASQEELRERMRPYVGSGWTILSCDEPEDGRIGYVGCLSQGNPLLRDEAGNELTDEALTALAEKHELWCYYRPLGALSATIEETVTVVQAREMPETSKERALALAEKVAKAGTYYHADDPRKLLLGCVFFEGSRAHVAKVCVHLFKADPEVRQAWTALRENASNFRKDHGEPFEYASYPMFSVS